jgi:hypothetical protein
VNRVRFAAALLLFSPQLAPAAWLPATRVETIAPGLTHSEIRFGEPVSSPRFVVAAGVEKDQKLADALLARVEALGFRAGPVYGRDGYEIRAYGFASLAEAEAAAKRLAAAGLSGATAREIEHDLSAEAGPFVVHVLEVDPGAIDVVVAHARDASVGLETTRELARRRGALAAVNGGFFRVSGVLAGESEGVLVLDGFLHSEPDRFRSGVGFADDPAVDPDGADRARFDRLRWCGELRLPNGTSLGIDGVDRARRDGEIVLYTSAFHRSTLTEPGGTEIIVADGRAVDVRRGGGSTGIPEEGFVLSFAPHSFPAGAIAVGDPLTWTLRLLPGAGDPDGFWQRAHSALGAGPLLLAGGQVVLRPELESISRVFTEARHPRTAVASRPDGTLLFVTVDGRQPGWSVGMTLAELVELLRGLGATDAVNLDGGGSTTMVIHGETVNRTSDPTGDRANGDAILLFPR